MKQNILVTLMFTCLLSTAATQADQCCQTDCCYTNECCDNGLDVYADWIFWRTRTCKLDYALPYDSSTAVGKVRSPDLGYDSGFRVGFAKECNCWIAGIEYTYYRSDASHTFKNADGHIAGTHIIDDNTVISQGSNIEFAKSNWCLDYDVVRLTLGRDLTFRNCINLNFFGGFNFAYIGQDFNNRYATAEDLTTASQDYVKEKISMDGYGISVGVSPEYQLSQCLSLFGSFSYDAYISNFDRSFKYYTSISGAELAEQVNLKDDCWGAVGTVNLTVALAYTQRDLFCSCGDLTIMIGYEFHNWFNSVGFLEYQNESGEINFDRYNESLGFDGLFVRLNGSF